MIARVRFALAALLVAACTPGGAAISGGSGGGANVTVIDVNLTLNAQVKTPYGQSAGYKPAITSVAVGSMIQFTNTDGFAHTATEVPGKPTSFPTAYPFTIAAETQSGHSLSGGFSSGAMPAGGSSQLIAVDKPGTYLYGCFFHYLAPMRGAIVAH
jgi:plastocyanin